MPRPRWVPVSALRPIVGVAAVWLPVAFPADGPTRFGRPPRVVLPSTYGTAAGGVNLAASEPVGTDEPYPPMAMNHEQVGAGSHHGRSVCAPVWRHRAGVMRVELERAEPRGRRRPDQIGDTLCP